MHDLIPHPATPPGRLRACRVSVVRRGSSLELRVWLEAGPDALVWPARVPGAGRRDGLWRTTCCEVFIRDLDGPGYLEFNVAPSGEWSAWSFERYRDGRSDLQLVHPPRITAAAPGQSGGRRSDGKTWQLSAGLTVPLALDRPWAASPTVVAEETDGTISYWALAHPEGAPDFHHPDCFVLPLGPSAGS